MGSSVADVIGRFPIIDIAPVVEGGAYPVKAVVDEAFDVSVTAFREGHDAMGVEVQFVPPGFTATEFAIGSPEGPLLRMHEVGPTQPDRWTVSARLPAEGDWQYYVISWGDPYETWKHKAEIKLPAGIDVELELEEGARVLDRAGAQATDAHARKVLTEAAAAMRDTQESAVQRLYAAEAPAVRSALEANPLRELPHWSGPWPVRVERRARAVRRLVRVLPPLRGRDARTRRARAPSAPRPCACPPSRPWASTWSTCRPIHPIGRDQPQGPEQHPHARARTTPARRGRSARAEGGHDAVHPDLGTIGRLRRASWPRPRELGMEVALDLALQARPTTRGSPRTPSGSRPAPTARSPTRRTRRRSTRTSTRSTSTTTPRASRRGASASCGYWMDHGVRIFRVDNPHTKPRGVLGPAARTRSTPPTPTCCSWPRRSPARR